MLRAMLRNMARAPRMGAFIGWYFKHLSRLSPVPLLLNEKRYVCFFHPAPSYEGHLLFLPKGPVRDFLSLKNDGTLEDILLCGAAALSRERFPEINRALQVNGGCQQDASQVYFHLFDRRDSYLRDVSRLTRFEGEPSLDALQHFLKERQGEREFDGYAVLFDLRAERPRVYFYFVDKQGAQGIT